jgi:hypothetical protein
MGESHRWGLWLSGASRGSQRQGTALILTILPISPDRSLIWINQMAKLAKWPFEGDAISYSGLLMVAEQIHLHRCWRLSTIGYNLIVIREKSAKFFTLGRENSTGSSGARRLLRIPTRSLDIKTIWCALRSLASFGDFNPNMTITAGT